MVCCEFEDVATYVENEQKQDANKNMKYARKLTFQLYE